MINAHIHLGADDPVVPVQVRGRQIFGIVGALVDADRSTLQMEIIDGRLCESGIGPEIAIGAFITILMQS